MASAVVDADGHCDATDLHHDGTGAARACHALPVKHATYLDQVVLQAK